MQPITQNCKTKPPLTHRHLAAIRLLLAGRSLPYAAAQIGVSRQTLWRWSQNPTFAAELNRLHFALLNPQPAPPRPAAPKAPPTQSPAARPRQTVEQILAQYGYKLPGYGKSSESSL